MDSFGFLTPETLAKRIAVQRAEKRSQYSRSKRRCSKCEVRLLGHQEHGHGRCMACIHKGTIKKKKTATMMDFVEVARIAASHETTQLCDEIDRLKKEVKHWKGAATAFEEGLYNSWDPDERFIREPERASITGLPRVSWNRLEDEGQAPKRIPIGPRTIAWKLSTLQEWIVAVSDGGTWSKA